MKIQIRFLVLIPVIFVLLACQTFTSYQTKTPVDLTEPDNIRSKPTFSPTSTESPSSTSTFTSKPHFPTLTPSRGVPPSATVTTIPINEQLRIFENLWSIVNDTYVYTDFNGLDWNAIHTTLKEKISTGLTSEQFYSELDNLIYSLGDDHSYFLNPEQVALQQAEYEGNHDYVGVGIYVSAVLERQRAVILSVFPGSPAEAAGLRPRDSILLVDGTSILDGDGYLRDIVRGPEGTTITMTVQSPGEPTRQIQLERSRITGNPPVAYQVITTPAGQHIGYILLLTFMDGSVPEQVSAALTEMSATGPLDGLILDNRMNEGGSSMVLDPVLGYFTGGTLGYFVNHSGKSALAVKRNNVGGSANVPLVVLVGSGTASFGEIFSGILKDIDRAYIIGTTTDGNVEILWGYDFEDGSELWLANETFQPLNHPEQNWENSGIVPDLTVSGGYDQFSFDNDPIIQAAVEYLSLH
jgi:carboxyl-terminal processing protease